MPPKKLISLLIIVAVIIAGIYMFNIFKKPSADKYFSDPKIIETRDFSCPGMTGFTFKYPVFEGWEVKNLYKKLTGVNDECVIELNYPDNIDFEEAPQILVQKIDRPAYPAPNSSTLEYPPKLTLNNPNKIPYQGDVINSSTGTLVTEAVHFITFYTNDFAVKISQNFFDIAKEDGFSGDQFFKTVIESFRILE